MAVNNAAQLIASVALQVTFYRTMHAHFVRTIVIHVKVRPPAQPVIKTTMSLMAFAMRALKAVKSVTMLPHVLSVSIPSISIS